MNLALPPRTGWLMLLFVQLASMTTIELTMSYWPVYLKMLLATQPREYLSLLTAAVLSIPPLLSIISIPIWGRLGDRFGHHKMVIRALLALFVAQFIISQSDSVYVIMLSRIIQGVFAGFLTAQQAYALNYHSKYWKLNPAKVIGQLQVMTALAGLIGPILGGYLMEQFGFQKLALASSLICLLGVLPVLLMPSDAAESRQNYLAHKQAKAEGSPIKIISWSIVAVFVIMAAIQICRAVDRPVFSLYMFEVMNVSESFMGPGFSANALGLIVSAPVFLRVAGNSPRALLRLMLAGACLAALMFLLVFELGSNEVWKVIVLRFGWGVALGALMPTAQTLLAVMAKSRNYGWLLGLGTSCAKLGATAGIMLGSSLLTLMPMQFVPLLQGLLYCVAALLVLLTMCCFRSKRLI